MEKDANYLGIISTFLCSDYFGNKYFEHKSAVPWNS